MQPGTYVTDSATDDCYWERDDSSGDIIANDIGSGQRIVTIESTDTDFDTERCGTWIPVAYAPTVSTIGDGEYLVGQQMAPGEYRANVSSGFCYWATLSDFTGQDNIIDNDDLGNGSAVVDVPNTAAGFESSGCGAWTRVG